METQSGASNQNTDDSGDTTYTRSDRPATLTYAGGGRARYGRDAQGRINRVWWRPSGTTTETTVVSAASYLPFGPLGSLTFGNGRTLAKAYDQNYWIDAVNGTPAGLSLDFGTDEVGNSKRPVTTPCPASRAVATSRAQSKEVSDGAGVEAGGLGEAGSGVRAQRVVATGLVWSSRIERVVAGRMALSAAA